MFPNRKRNRVLDRLLLTALRKRHASPYRLTEKEKSADLTAALLRRHRRALRRRRRPRAPRSAAAELARSCARRPFLSLLFGILFHPVALFRRRNKKRGFLAHFLRRRQLSPLLPKNFYDTEPEPPETLES